MGMFVIIFTELVPNKSWANSTVKLSVVVLITFEVYFSRIIFSVFETFWSDDTQEVSESGPAFPHRLPWEVTLQSWLSLDILQTAVPWVCEAMQTREWAQKMQRQSSNYAGTFSSSLNEDTLL